MMYKKEDYCICVGELTGYKKPCLLIGKDTRLRKVGTFNDQDAADSFMELFQFFMGQAGNNQEME